jgi:hypothetical protein
MHDSFLAIQISGNGIELFIVNSIERSPIKLDGIEFAVELKSNKACYYDWMRLIGGEIIGLKFTEYWEKKIGRRIDKFFEKTKDGEFAIFFNSKREYDPGWSADQTDWGSKLFSKGNTFVLTFALNGSTLSSSEVKQIEEIVYSRKNKSQN